jgi:hypothetical protein
MMTAYFEHESLTALQAACVYVHAAFEREEDQHGADPIPPLSASEASPGVAVVRHADRALVMTVIGRMTDTDHNTLVGVEWTEASTETE